jgi:hypothetical protein
MNTHAKRYFATAVPVAGGDDGVTHGTTRPTKGIAR